MNKFVPVELGYRIDEGEPTSKRGLWEILDYKLYVKKRHVSVNSNIPLFGFIRKTLCSKV